MSTQILQSHRKRKKKVLLPLSLDRCASKRERERQSLFAFILSFPAMQREEKRERGKVAVIVRPLGFMHEEERKKERKSFLAKEAQSRLAMQPAFPQREQKKKNIPDRSSEIKEEKIPGLESWSLLGARKRDGWTLADAPQYAKNA